MLLALNTTAREVDTSIKVTNLSNFKKEFKIGSFQINIPEDLGRVEEELEQQINKAIIKGEKKQKRNKPHSAPAGQDRTKQAHPRNQDGDEQI